MNGIPSLSSSHSLKSINFNFGLWHPKHFERDPDNNFNVWTGCFRILSTLSPAALLTHINVNFNLYWSTTPTEYLRRVFQHVDWRHISHILRSSPSTRLKIQFRSSKWRLSEAHQELLRESMVGAGISRYELDVEL